MAAAEAEAVKNNWALVITILDSGGNLVMAHRMDNAPLASIGISRGKARTGRFRCVMALAENGQVLDTFDGAVEGTIIDRKSTRLNSSHRSLSRMPSSA